MSTTPGKGYPTRKEGAPVVKRLRPLPFPSLPESIAARTRRRDFQCRKSPPRFFACRIFGLLPESGAPRPLRTKKADRAAGEKSGRPQHPQRNRPPAQSANTGHPPARTSRQRPDTSRKTGPPALSANTGHTPYEPTDSTPTQAAKPAHPLSRQAPDTRANRPAPGSRFVSG